MNKEASTSNNSRQVVGLKVRQPKRAENFDIMKIMVTQMRPDVEERAHDRREKAGDQREMAKDRKK